MAGTQSPSPSPSSSTAASTAASELPSTQSSTSLQSSVFSSPSVTNSTLSPLSNVTQNSNVTGVTGVTDTPSDGGLPAGTIVAILATIIFGFLLIAFVYRYLLKSGKLRRSSFGFSRVRSRRSSTSDSRHVLDDVITSDEVSMKNDSTRLQYDIKDDAFTIDDMEEEVRQDGDEEYYYDEVFGQSPFGDERTNTSVRELSHAPDDHEEELLDYDFETLGIKMDSAKYDSREKY